MSNPTRAEVEAAVAARIEAEPGFRERLLEDPRAVLAEVLGYELPDVVTVTVHEESLTDIHLTIPAAGDLADADLELVAGGGDICWNNLSKSNWEDRAMKGLM